jgi:hypothetical protein
MPAYKLLTLEQLFENNVDHMACFDANPEHIQGQVGRVCKTLATIAD